MRLHRVLVRVAAVAIVGLLPLLATGEARGQPAAPATLVGVVTDVRVNGRVWDGVTPLEAINGAGDPVAQATVEEGLWMIRVPSDVGETFRLRVGPDLSEPIAFVTGLLEPVLTLGEAPIRRFNLSAGFQAVTHVGPELSVPEFVAQFSNPAAVEAIFVWDASAGTWSTWRPALPPSLQGFDRVPNNQPMLLALNSASVYGSEVVAHNGGAWQLSAGFAGAAFLGVDGTSLADALAQAGGVETVTAIFRFNNATQGWDAFQSALPISFSGITSFNRWEVLLVRSSGAGLWGYLAFSP